MWPDMDATKPVHFTDGLPAVTMLVSRAFADSFYESCAGMRKILGLDALGMMCGRDDNCNPSTLLNYMGNIENGKAPFPIVYKLADVWVAPDNTTLRPLNTYSARCNHEIEGSNEYIGKFLLSNKYVEINAC